ncbi:MAG: DUF433 domain-containing protein [Methylocella sp.]
MSQHPPVMGGKPSILNQRVTCRMIVGQVSSSRSIKDLLADYL